MLCVACDIVRHSLRTDALFDCARALQLCSLTKSFGSFALLLLQVIPLLYPEDMVQSLWKIDQKDVSEMLRSREY
jgi:hypothetical protein